MILNIYNRTYVKF